MSSSPTRVVVVGAGLAGLRTVESLRQLGYEGALTLIGAESHRPYSRPPLSKEILRGEAGPEKAQLRTPEAYDELRLDLRLGCTATGVDTDVRTVTLDDGSTVPYDRLVVATGATPRLLPGIDAVDVHVLRTLDDALGLQGKLADRPSVAVVGAGFIGSEVASSARELGCDVTVVEAAAAPLVHALGPQVAEACSALQREHGVDLRTGVGVTGVRDGSVLLDDGSAVAADVIVVGVGVAPEVRWLAESDISIDDGVLCDEFCRTSAAGVYAVGDLALWDNPLFGEPMRLEHWTNATEQAAAVARNLLGDAEPFAPVPYFWSDQFGTKIQVLGRPRADDDLTITHGSLESRKFVAVFGREGRLTGVVGFKSARHVMAYRTLLTAAASYDDALSHAAAS